MLTFRKNYSYYDDTSFLGFLTIATRGVMSYEKYR